MKILFISRFIPYTGGREVLLQRILHKLSKKFEIILATPDIGYTTPDFKIINFKNKNELQKIVNDLNPDIIHLHTFYLAKYIINFAKKNKIKTILTLHGLFFNNYDDKYRTEILKVIKKIDLVTVVCDKHLNELLENKIEKSKIKLVRNGIDAHNFSFNLDKKRLRNILNLPENDIILVASARLTKLKGLEYLVSSLKDIKNINVKLLLSSPTGRYNDEETQYRNQLIDLSDKLKVREKLVIQFHENSSMGLIYKASDIFVLPSITEGTPLSLLEAMSSGIICVSTNVGEVSEIITPDTGHLIKPNQSKAISDKINQIISKKYNDSEMILRAQERIINQFSENDMINNYEKIYYNLIK